MIRQGHSSLNAAISASACIRMLHSFLNSLVPVHLSLPAGGLMCGAAFRRRCSQAPLRRGIAHARPVLMTTFATPHAQTWIEILTTVCRGTGVTPGRTCMVFPGPISLPHLHGLAEAHLIADEGAPAVAQRKAHALALECHQPPLQARRDARVPLRLVRHGCGRLRPACKLLQRAVQSQTARWRALRQRRPRCSAKHMHIAYYHLPSPEHTGMHWSLRRTASAACNALHWSS